MLSKIHYGLVALLLALVAGCGGGGGSSSNATKTGKAVFSLQWATRSRDVPAAANSVLIQIMDNATKLAERLVERPAGGGTSKVTLDNLPVGNHTARLTAFPKTDGTGNAVGKTEVFCKGR